MIVVGWSENNKKANLNELAEAIIFVAFPMHLSIMLAKYPKIFSRRSSSGCVHNPPQRTHKS